MIEKELNINGDFFDKLGKLDKTYFLNKTVEAVGVLAVNFSKRRFIHKNWKDKKTEAWKPRKRKNRGSLMIKSGRLKRSIRKLAVGRWYVIIGTDAPYAQIHNEGGTIKERVKVRAHSRTRTLYAKRKRRKEGQSRYTKKKVGSVTMHVRSHYRNMNVEIPKRQFLGNSHALAKHIEIYMLAQIKRELK